MLNILILSEKRSIHSTERLFVEGQKRGHKVDIAKYTRCCGTVGFEAGVFVDSKPLPIPDAIIPRIAASVTSHGAAIIRQYELMGVYSTTSSTALARSRDKLRCLQSLSQAGISVPKTAFARHPKDADSIINQLGGPPLIIKLQEGTQGMGVVLAETKSAARSVIQAFHKLKANIIVQEFIAESKASDIRAIVVGDRVVAAMRRQGLETDFRSNLHRGGRGEQVTLSKEEHAAAVKSAAALGLQIAGVDMLQSKTGPKVIEVNSSPGLEGIEQISKVNVAGCIIEFIEQAAAARKTGEAI